MRSASRRVGSTDRARRRAVVVITRRGQWGTRRFLVLLHLSRPIWWTSGKEPSCPWRGPAAARDANRSCPSAPAAPVPPCRWDGGWDGASGAGIPSVCSEGRRGWPLPPTTRRALAGRCCGVLPGVPPAAAGHGRPSARPPCLMPSLAQARAGFQYAPGSSAQVQIHSHPPPAWTGTLCLG